MSQDAIAPSGRLISETTGINRQRFERMPGPLVRIIVPPLFSQTQAGRFSGIAFSRKTLSSRPCLESIDSTTQRVITVSRCLVSGWIFSHKRQTGVGGHDNEPTNHRQADGRTDGWTERPRQYVSQ